MSHIHRLKRKDRPVRSRDHGITLSHRRRPMQAAIRQATWKRLQTESKRIAERLNALKNNNSRLLFWLRTYSPDQISPNRIEQFRKNKIKRVETQQRINFVRRQGLK